MKYPVEDRRCPSLSGQIEDKVRQLAVDIACHLKYKSEMDHLRSRDQMYWRNLRKNEPLSPEEARMGLGFPSGSDGKESACSAGGPDSIPGSGRSPGEGNGSPHQYSCLENPMDGGAWWAAVHGVTKSRTRLSN